jgi:hypothetical protein
MEISEAFAAAFEIAPALVRDFASRLPTPTNDTEQAILVYALTEAVKTFLIEELARRRLQALAGGEGGEE